MGHVGYLSAMSWQNGIYNPRNDLPHNTALLRQVRCMEIFKKGEIIPRERLLYAFVTDGKAIIRSLTSGYIQ